MRGERSPSKVTDGDPRVKFKGVWSRQSLPESKPWDSQMMKFSFLSNTRLQHLFPSINIMKKDKNNNKMGLIGWALGVPIMPGGG